MASEKVVSAANGGERQAGGPMAGLAYYSDQYLKSTESRVSKIEGARVLLENTIFFPATSSEPQDSGTIAGQKISDVKKAGSDVWHVLQEAPRFKEGDMVRLELDWETRFLAMRLHSALHLFAGVFETKFGDRAVAGTVGERDATIVFKKKLERSAIDEALKAANDLITTGADIVPRWDEKLPGFRWVAIGTFPPIPCGGLHVKNAREIGPIHVSSEQFDGSRHKVVLSV